jgi:hypothetical protein
MFDMPDELSTNDRLTLIRVKIERARKQLRELEAELMICRGQRKNVIIAQFDPDTGEEVPNSERCMNLQVLTFNAIATAGDIIHNLRSALDHLAHQLVRIGSPGKEVSRRIEFPIAKDLATYESDKTGKIKGMRPEAKKAIDELKPYKGGNDSLWRIHELDNFDKHRALFTVASDYLFTNDWTTYYLFKTGPFGHPLKAGTPDFVGVFDSEVEQDVQLEIEKAVGEMKVAESNALLPSLHQLVDFIDGLVASFIPLLK